MSKEILTVADCRERLLEANDVNSREARRAVLHMLLFSLSASAVLEMIICLPLVLASEKMPIWCYVLVILLCLFLPTVLLSIIFHSRAQVKMRYQKILQNGIEIVEDTLKRAYEDGRSRGRHYELFYVLDFQNNGSYEIPKRQHYAWSKLYSMSHSGVYYTSVAGDTFYIVRLKDGPQYEILEVYNTKLFELCPDGTEKKPRSSWRDSVSVE